MRLGKRKFWQFLVGFFLQAMPGAMLVPVLTLGLAARGVDATLIGALATVGSLAYICALPAAPALIGRIGAATTQRVALGVRLVAVLALTSGDWPALWVALYAALGFSAGLLYTIAETWVPALAGAEARGRAMAIYQTVVGASSFVGASLALATGVTGPLPLVIAVAALLLSLAFLWPLEAPAVSPAESAIEVPRANLQGLLAQIGPAVLAASLLGGLFEAGLAVALPLYGLTVGATPALAAGLAAALGLGSLAQYPFGAMADRWPWQRVVVGTAAAIAASALLLPLAPGAPWLLLPLGVVWGSAGGGLYTLASIRNAARFRGERLVGVSVVTQFAYMAGEAVGPTASGLAIDLAPAYGLPILVGGTAVLGLATMLGATVWQRRAAERSAISLSERGSTPSAALH